MTLTREEILNQPPGRKLDRWIQEHIFKWIPWAEQRREYIAIVYQKPGEREPYTRVQNWEKEKERYSIIPYSEIDFLLHAVYGDEDWSTNISAAWKVDEKIRELGLDEVWGNRISRIIFMDNERPSGTFDIAHASAEQRCKAALLAVLNL